MANGLRRTTEKKIHSALKFTRTCYNSLRNTRVLKLVNGVLLNGHSWHMLFNSNICQAITRLQSTQETRNENT